MCLPAELSSTISGDLTVYGTVDGLTVNAGGLAIVEAGGVVQGTVAAQGTLEYSDGLDNTGLLAIAGNAASLAVTGLLFNSGILDVGAGTSVMNDGTYQQKSLEGGPGPVLQLQVQGTGGSDYGSVAVTGTVDLRDSNALDILVTQAPAAGSSFTIMTFTPGNLLGMFVTLTGSGGSSAGSGTSQNRNGLTAGLLYDGFTLATLNSNTSPHQRPPSIPGRRATPATGRPSRSGAMARRPSIRTPPSVPMPA